MLFPASSLLPIERLFRSPSTDREHSAGNNSRGATLLVVDDDPSCRSLLGSVLELYGFGVRTSSDGTQAMLLLTESPVDLAIVDLMMPITGGLQFLRWLRTERRSSLPVIVYTGHDNPTKLEAAYNAGADRVLVKPAGLEDLVAEINALLASRSKPTADPHPLLCATSAAASLGLI